MMCMKNDVYKIGRRMKEKRRRKEVRDQSRSSAEYNGGKFNNQKLQFHSKPVHII